MPWWSTGQPRQFETGVVVAAAAVDQRKAVTDCRTAGAGHHKRTHPGIGRLVFGHGVIIQGGAGDGVLAHRDQGAGKIVHRLRVNVRCLVIHIDRDRMHTGHAAQGERNAGSTVQGGEATGERDRAQVAVCGRGTGRFHLHPVREVYADQQVVGNGLIEAFQRLPTATSMVAVS